MLCANRNAADAGAHQANTAHVTYTPTRPVLTTKRFQCISARALRTEDDVDPLSLAPSALLRQLASAASLVDAASASSSAASRASTSHGTSVLVTHAYRLRHRLANVSDTGALAERTNQRT